MINVSDNFKTAASAPVKMVKATVIIDPFSETPTTVTESDALISYTIESSGELFGSAAALAKIKLLGSDYEGILGKTIRILYSIAIDSAGLNYEQIDYGYFVVTEAPITKGAETTTIKAQNMMGVMQSSSYETGIEFPITIAGLASAVASRFGLTVADMSELPNVNYTISEDLYKNISETNYRSILAEVAGATATMATVEDNSLKVIFRTPQKTVQGALNYETLKSLTVGAHYGPVNSVVLSRSPQEDNIAVTDQESVEANGLTEVKLANNEIMDDERTVFIENILTAVDGIEWTGFEATTVGHGWYEIGDRLSFTDSDGNVWEGIVTYHSITIDGGVKETIKGVIPEETTTDYALAGGIMKTIYNTEIKVDKQNKEIQSIVEEQTTFENETATNFTNVTQNISSVVTSVQNSGGNNLIKNSAMYAKENSVPTNWSFSGSGTYATTPSADASANGSLSGQVISLSDITISQIITVKPDDDGIAEANKTYYSFGCRVKKGAAGSATIVLSDGTEEGIWTISIPNGKSANYDEYAVEAILPHSAELTLSVYATSDAGFFITDMMLSVGNYRSQWTQANGEFSNSQVQINIDGITVKNNNLSGTYTKQTAQEIEIYNSNQLTARLSDEQVSAASGVFTKEIDLSPIKIVAQSDGIAFVKKEK